MNKEHFIERLSEKYPDNFSKYSYDFLPDSFFSSEPVDMFCKEHGLFRQRPSKHLLGAGCTSCYRERQGSSSRIGVDGFSLRSRDKFGNKFSFEHTVYKNKDSKVKITCSRHGVIDILPWRHLKLKTGCQFCEKEYQQRISFRSFLEKSKAIHGDRYDYSKVVFKGFNSKILIICKQHGEFVQRATNHAHDGSICPKCSVEESRLTTEKFIEKSKLIHGDKFDYSKVEYSVNSEKVLIICPEHGLFKQSAASHLSGSGCLKCSILNRRKTRKEFIEEAKKVHGDRYEYSKVRFTHTKLKVIVTCKIHGDFLVKPNAHLTSASGCSRCKESKGETAVGIILEDLGVKFLKEYKVEGFLYRYDFYVPEVNLFIEFHGKQHYAPVEFFGGIESHRETVRRDKIKKSIVGDLGAHLLVVNYLDLHGDRLKSKITKVIDSLMKRKKEI